MPERRFHLVDVFGERPLTGNPLAVVVDSEGLSIEQMLEITRWLNFSETTFLLPPDQPEADYRVRIFTLAGELPFAGHPTLGTCHVWQAVIADAPQEEVVQECGAGLVRLRRNDDTLAFAAPPLLRDGPVSESHLEALADVLGVDMSEIVDSEWVDNGPGWVGVLLDNAQQVLELKPDFSRYEGHDRLDIGVVGFYPKEGDVAYEVRAFFSDDRGRMIEDPVTGSLNASVAQWMLGSGRVDQSYVASQGAALGRSGRIHIDQTEDGSIWVGGRVFDIVDGQLGRFINGLR